MEEKSVKGYFSYSDHHWMKKDADLGSFKFLSLNVLKIYGKWKTPSYLKTGTQKAILKLLNGFISLLHSLECANQPYSPKPLSLSYQLKSRIPFDFPKD